MLLERRPTFGWSVEQLQNQQSIMNVTKLTCSWYHTFPDSVKHNIDFREIAYTSKARKIGYPSHRQ